MSLEAQKISFAYYSRAVLEEISLSLRPGEFLGFLGPNGSGKSTFLKNLLGFLKPSHGRIVFSGADQEPGREERARRLALVPQSSGLRAVLSVRELVLMGRLPHLRDRWAGYSKADRAKADEVLDALGLAAMAERNVLSLSGGEMQKVIIGRCLAQEGDIILLDEATSGLDLNHTIEIMELMRRKAGEEGKTVVAVLHDLNLAAQYCDRIVLLKNGRIRCQGLPGEVLTGEVVEEIYGIRAVVKQDEYGRPVILPRRAEGPEIQAGAPRPRRAPSPEAAGVF
ncbi:MAG: ABC transporter ATP-binding protein [Treponema sp.]|jgi:iron complex transport system ATP-binding protein|nr:ABC transporter ATP-binding protein [Treponema sp.]